MLVPLLLLLPSLNSGTATGQRLHCQPRLSARGPGRAAGVVWWAGGCATTRRCQELDEPHCDDAVWFAALVLKLLWPMTGIMCSARRAQQGSTALTAGTGFVQAVLGIRRRLCAITLLTRRLCGSDTPWHCQLRRAAPSRVSQTPLLHPALLLQTGARVSCSNQDKPSKGGGPKLAPMFLGRAHGLQQLPSGETQTSGTPDPPADGTEQRPRQEQRGLPLPSTFRLPLPARQASASRRSAVRRRRNC